MTLLQKRIRKAMKIIDEADKKIIDTPQSNGLRAPHMSEKDLAFCLKTLYEIGGHFNKK